MENITNLSRDGLLIFHPFANLPSRSLVDYYQVIKHPVSLKSVHKLVRGIHGRNPPTGISDFQSWDAFEKEVQHIWNNCRTYNEDGSEMYNLSEEFEVGSAILLCCSTQGLIQSRKNSQRFFMRHALWFVNLSNRNSNSKSRDQDNLGLRSSLEVRAIVLPALPALQPQVWNAVHRVLLSIMMPLHANRSS